MRTTGFAAWATAKVRSRRRSAPAEHEHGEAGQRCELGFALKPVSRQNGHVGQT